MTKTAIQKGRPIKSTEKILRQIQEVRESVEDMQDYLDLLEARVSNKGRRRYSMDSVKKRIGIK